MRLNFHTLDVFTERRFGGNPLAVVHGADGLDDAQMQTIAREFNLSETVFVLKPQSPMSSARVRLFTPLKELPFAGHPTVGTAALLAELKGAGDMPGNDALIVLEQQIGTLRVGVRMRAGAASFAEFDSPRIPVEAGALPHDEVLAAGLGLIPSEIGFENHRPVCFAAGNAFAFVPVESLEALERARINGADWAKAFDEQGIVGAYLYTRRCQHVTSSFHARMFAPATGVPEDPATGSAAVCLAGVVHHFDDLQDGHHKKVVEQGFTMGRPSFITLSLTVTAGKLTTVRIGGHVVRVSEGVLEV